MIFKVLKTVEAPNGSERQYTCTLVAQDGTGYDVDCGIFYHKGQQFDVPVEKGKPLFAKVSAALGEGLLRKGKLKETSELYV